MMSQAFESLIPFHLKAGDTIGVMAPSSYVEKADLEASKALLEERGYKVFIHPQSYERDGQSAGTVLQKSMALQGLWMRDDIDLIWAAGGGNQSLPLLSSINFEKMKGKRKALAGFSDVTTLINALPFHGCAQTFHAPVFRNLHKSPDQLDSCLNVMSGEEHIIFTFNDKQILQGGQQAEGRLIGGNLSIVQYLPSLLGMGYFDGALLCIEDCGEELSRIDRMFSYMKAVGAFSKISGLLCGDFSALSDTGRPYEKTIQQIIMDNCGDLDIPILSDLAFGHGALNSCIPLGLKAVLNGSEKTISLK